MEELIYFCVRIVCIGYLLYSVYSWRRRIETVCTLLYGKPCVKKEKKEAAGTESAVSDAEVMGSTRYVYLDENAGKTASISRGTFGVSPKYVSTLSGQKKA